MTDDAGGIKVNPRVRQLSVASHKVLNFESRGARKIDGCQKTMIFPS